MPKTCPLCAASFDCSGCAGGACWCSAFPAIFSCAPAGEGSCLDSSAECLCPKCLTAKTRDHIAQFVDTQAVHSSAPQKALACAGQPLIEGLDYEMEKGLFVLSRWHLLKRGECCGNSCRNCPYGYKNVK
jgi:Family of unknown function (DUF5522)